MIKDKKYILILFMSMTIALVMSITPIGQKWELSSYDWRMHIAGNMKKLNDSIVIIGIDDKSLDKIGQWPWPRDKYAEIINILTNAGVKGIVFDLLFNEPDRHKKDMAFSKSMKKSANVILPVNFENKGYKTGLKTSYPLDILKTSAYSFGFVDNINDLDGIVRRICLAEKDSQNKIIPSLDLSAFALYKGISDKDIVYQKKSIKVGDEIIPTDENYIININYLNFKRENSGISVFVEQLAPISFSDIILKDNRIFKSRICYIGATTEGLKDIFETSFKSQFGLIIHAQVLNTLLQKQFIKNASVSVNLLFFFLPALLGFFIFPRFRTFKVFLFFITITVVFITANMIFFHYGYYIKLINSLLFLFLLFLFTFAYQFSRTRRIFGQFVDEEFIDQMLDSEKKQKLGGMLKEVSILFSDIRGYTSLSEKMKPTQIMDLLNIYHSRMNEIFKTNHGRIFDYQGDAQMVVFGMRQDDTDHALNAVKAALMMRDEIEIIKKEWREVIPLEFNVGIGICTGEVSLGLVGANEHKQYAAIGDATNVSSRLQGLSGQLGCNIIISQTTYDYVKEEFDVKKFKDIMLKGKAEPMDVYGILGCSTQSTVR